MFESLVANILNRFLGSYIENFDPKQLNIGIWSGDVKLKNLRLKKESLDKFKLPLDVKFGHIGELTLQIPWSNLKSKPVKVIIEDVYLLASPIILQDFDVDEENKRELLVKREMLESLETIQAASSQNNQISQDLNSNESFTESLVTKIVDNAQVVIKNIHVRYEDDSILTDDPYSMGVTLNELSAVSTDDSWVPSFISLTQKFTHKLLTLKNLSCYMNTNSESIYTDDHEQLLISFKNSIILDSSLVDDSQFLLKPVSGNGRITLHKPGPTDQVPHIKAELFFHEFGIELDSQQYQDFLWTASKFHWYIKTQKFRKFRPKVNVEDDPKKWFQYAAKSVLNEIHDKNYKWSWAHFEKRRDQRKAYIQLWKAKIQNAISTTQKQELEELEDELPYEDIKFYRSLTRSEIRKENSAISPVSGAVKSSADKSGSGWLSYIWGNSDSKAPEVEDKELYDSEKLDLHLSEDQRKALYDAIDYDENQELIDSVSIPRDRVKLEIAASLEKGGISIKKTKGSPNLAEIVFEGCTTQIYQRPDSLLAKFQLQEFRVEDGTGSTMYKHIVSVKQLHSSFHEVPKGHAESEPFFQISFENNPLDLSADSILLAKLKSMTVFYNPKFIEEVFRFFKPPAIHLDTVGAIMNAAEATMEGITEQTRIGLQYALEEHKTINVKLDLQAPLIILPLDPSSFKSPVAILDAGHISVVSDLVEKSKIEEIKSKENYTSKDWEQLTTMMYDKFDLHLQDAQFLVGPDIKSTMEQLHNQDGDRPSLILDKLNIKLLMSISILPDAYNLAKFKMGGEVPAINLNINDFQYKTIMQIIDVAIPDFDKFDSEESSVFNAFSTFADNKVEEIESSGQENKISSFQARPLESHKQSEAIAKQHVLEFDLVIGVVNVSLSRCINGITLEAEPLIDLIGTSFDMNFIKTLYGMHIDLSLADIDMIDHIERSGVPEFEKIISSNNFEDKLSHKKLFKLDYSRNQRIVDFNGKEIEVFDQDIKLDIATVKFIVSRKSLLSILNFVLNTFTDPNAEATPADELKHNDSENDEVSPQKINVDVKLDSIILVMNEDGLKLATLQLSTANINVFLVPEEMEITGTLGALTLHDEINQGSPRDSLLRNLINIDGDNLAEFRYKTYDNETNNNPYSSLIEFKTGSITVNFVESSLSRIFDYLSQFLKMKAIYDKARDAAINQASLIDDVNKIKFNLLIQAPTIVFPKMVVGSNDKYDTITARLGEIYAFNDFLVDESSNLMKNYILLGVRKISLFSNFHFGSELLQTSEILKNLDIAFKVDYYEEYTPGIPTFNVNGNMPETELKLTELQLKSLLAISNSVSKVFTFPESDEHLEDIEEDAANANAVVKHNTAIIQSKVQTSTKKQEIEAPMSNEIPPEHKNVAMSFIVPRVSLTIYNKTYGMDNFESKKLTSFVLNDFNFSFEMNKDSHFASNLNVRSFVVRDVRESTQSKFTELIPSTNSKEDQFILVATTDGPADKKNITVMLTVDNPTTILALDYLFELQTFFTKGLEIDKPILEYEEEEEEHDNESGTEKGAEDLEAIQLSRNITEPEIQTVGFTVNIKEPTIILLEDPKREDTIAVFLKAEQLLLTSQNVISLAANNIGMFLSQMNDLDSNKYRIIDDFSMSFAHDSCGSTPTSLLTNIQAAIDPILLRVSLRDIRLALSIANNASELYNKAQPYSGERDDKYNFSEDFKRRLSQYAPSVLTERSAMSNNKRGSREDNIVVRGEEFSASVGGVRFVLIGDVHELPVLDMNVKPFEVRAINWSTDLSAEAHLELFVNIFNYSRSSWETLIEPWPIAVYASKSLTPKPRIVVDVISRQLAEFTVTSRSVALLSQISSLITTEDTPKPRDQDSPYLIVNETGYDIEVWPDHEGTKQDRTVIKSLQKIPWSFEDWRKIRENLDSNNKAGVLGVNLLNSSYDEVSNISATGEGEEIFMLYPPVKGVHNRLSCEITLGDDNVKTIWLRSTIILDNEVDIPIVFQFLSDSQDFADEEFVVESMKSKALPIDFVYSGRLRIRPFIEAKYKWSNETMYWKDLLHSGKALSCPSANCNDDSIYYFQVEAKFDKDEPLGRIYPHMKLVISAPVEIENLLPFDLNYRLYDKNLKKDWNGSIEKGVKSFVHVVSLTNLLLISVEPKGCGYSKSEFAIVNVTKKSEFQKETTINLRHSDGQQLKLKIHYPKKNSSNSSLRLSIYCPYIILNRAGQDLIISEKGNELHSSGKSSFSPIIPNMFSFDRYGDRNNRALLKISGSGWTSPLSLDAIGQSVSANCQITGKQKEMNVGISVTEGEGKYNLSKVITIAPRYIIKNTLDESLNIVENGSTKQLTLEPNQLMPLYGLRRTQEKCFLLKFAHLSKTWSSPFTLDDIGQVFIKVFKENVGQVLLKINILIENATIFIQIGNANNNWPYSIRNFSDSEFFIYQNDPNVNENGERVKNDTQYKPIYYKIPPKSVMPYAYDYPNAIIKELVIRSHGRERAINLAEIGNLRPFRLPPTDDFPQAIVDLNVVADGPTQSLIITNYEPSVSLYKLKGKESGSSASLSQNFESTEKDENYHTRIVTKFEGFGISLINTRNQELCYITLRGLELRYNESDIYQNFSVKLKWIQIDNQLYGGIFPIVVYPTVIPKSGKEMNNHPAVSGSICKVKDESHGVLFIKYATILLQEMTIEIDEDFLFALLDFAKFPGASWNKESIDRLCDESLELPEPERLSESSDIYFEALHLQPTQTNLSFVRTERVNAEDKSSSQNTLMFFFNVLTMAMGNINDAPIKLNALFIENIRVPIPILLESIKTHYGQSFFYQVHKILGSADFLGNPVGLFNHLSSGVLDIFYEPYQGFIINDRPQELGIGIAKGGLSFLKKSIFGFSDSFAKVTGSIAKGLTVATLDRKFQERRRLNQRRNKPKHALYGVASGANSFFDSISSGVSGIATAPIEGASSGGAAGFFKGLGKGFVGLPTKTAIGFFDLASNVSEGIRNTTTVFDAEGLDKVRLPRYISDDNVIRPFSQREAQGQYWLNGIDNGVLFNEKYLAHLLLSGEENAVMVTYRMIILFEVQVLKSRWIIKLEQVKSISVEPKGIQISLKTSNGQFLPITERANRNFLYNRISVAVEEFNKHCQVIL